MREKNTDFKKVCTCGEVLHARQNCEKNQLLAHGII